MPQLPRFQTDDTQFQMLQTAWASQLNPIINSPILQGLTLENVSLSAGSNTINHKLGRKLQGWIIVRKSAASEIYDLQSSNTMTDKTLILSSQNPCVVNIYVF